MPEEIRDGREMQDAAIRIYRQRVAKRQAQLVESLYDRWVKTREMGRFLKLLERRLAGRPLPPKMAVWFAWTRRYIAQNDPFSDRALAALLVDAEALEPDPIDNERGPPEEQEWRALHMLDDLVAAIEAEARARE